MQNIGKYIKQRKGVGYYQENPFQHQRGWQQNGARTGQYNGQLTDEQYYASLAIHEPLWRYIVRHYVKEIYGKNIDSVNILGYRAIPVAIELSQWGYEVAFLTPNHEEIKRAKKDYEIQAGFVKDNIWFDYRSNVPPATITCFIGLLDEFPEYKMYEFLDMCLRRSEEIVCAVKNNHDWEKILDGRYDFTLQKYPVGGYSLLTIKELEL